MVPVTRQCRRAASKTSGAGMKAQDRTLRRYKMLPHGAAEVFADDTPSRILDYYELKRNTKKRINTPKNRGGRFRWVPQLNSVWRPAIPSHQVREAIATMDHSRSWSRTWLKRSKSRSGRKWERFGRTSSPFILSRCQETSS